MVTESCKNVRQSSIEVSIVDILDIIYIDLSGKVQCVFSSFLFSFEQECRCGAHNLLGGSILLTINCKIHCDIQMLLSQNRHQEFASNCVNLGSEEKYFRGSSGNTRLLVTEQDIGQQCTYVVHYYVHNNWL